MKQTETAFELRRLVHRIECVLLCRTADMLFAIAFAIVALPVRMTTSGSIAPSNNRSQ